MRIKLDLDESLLEAASHLTGIERRAALIHCGLQELIRRESGRLLAALGSKASLKPITRRRTAPARTPKACR
ncbi:MAG TPA: type II toxin-antitoxin system VapB family antitoxin [Bryobacteraceae bacterium]